MALVKNQEYEITIEDMGNDGEGIGHIDGFTVFVKDTVMGDRCRIGITKVKKQYAFARLIALLEPSPFRVEPRCPKARSCGGCTMQHIAYEKQLEYKRNKVKNCLERIGGVENAESLMEPIVGMFTPEEAAGITQQMVEARICEHGHYNYRNKAQFPVGTDRQGNIVAGFYAGRTHTIIPVETCHIQAPETGRIMDIVCRFLNRNRIPAYDEETHRGLVRHILTRVGFCTGEIMVCLVINGDRLPKSEELVKELAGLSGMTGICLNINREKTNRILGEQCVTLWGQSYITDYIGDVKYQISPLSFYQVNPAQTKLLYEKALAYAALTGGETVWDLYCGIGTISLFLAQRAKHVYGVELIPQAIEDARRNAEINGITNTTFFVGKAEEVLPREYEKNHIYADVIVVDPPRKGCDRKALETMAAMAPARIVYVSCDPATLARDVKWLGEHGYELRKVAVFDQFCHCGHCESAVLMSRVEGQEG